jgi:hypothetical protein
MYATRGRRSAFVHFIIFIIVGPDALGPQWSS